MDRIRVIERSLRCSTFGWIALAPVLGIPAAVRAIVLYRQVQAELRAARFKRNGASDYVVTYQVVEGSQMEWNPARKHLLLGCILAWCGLALSLFFVGGLVLLALRVLLQSGN